MAPSNIPAVQELLLRNGVDPATAKYAAMNEFAGFNVSSLTEFWKRVKRPRMDFCPCRDSPPQQKLGKHAQDSKEPVEIANKCDFDVDQWISKIFESSPTWIKAPRDLMEQAVQEDKALCLNAQGQWSLRSTGYMALSHVWIEGIQSDPDGRGFQQKQLARIFEVIKRTGAEWIWMDVLAIPGGGGPTSTLKDEMLKIEIINTMASVYSKADAVIVLDALVLQLHPQTALDVAIALRCGRWATRIWTYQEIKLATRALIVTAQAVYDFAELIKIVESVIAGSPHMKELHNYLGRLQRRDDLGVSIPDIVTACQTRKAGFDLDYARAFFPTLGLRWEEGMTREEGMQMIYRAQKFHASRIVSFHGCPRLGIRPAWAPSYFTGLEGVVGKAQSWEERGLRGEWHVLKVHKVLHTFTQFKKLVFNLQLDGDQGRHIQCVLADTESEATIQGLKAAIEGNLVYILSNEPSAEAIKSGFARTVLLVEQALTIAGTDFEVFVHATAVVTTVEAYPEELRSVLLRHESTAGDEGPSETLRIDQRLASQLRFAIQFHDQETNLHAAVRAHQLDTVRGLVEQGASLQARDSKNWTPLHTAAAEGEVEILELLLSRSRDSLADLLSESGQKDHGFTLLSVAAEKGRLSVVKRLLQEKPDQYTIDNSLLAAADDCECEVVEELLAAGANPNFSDPVGRTPLYAASGKYGNGLLTMQALLDAGANVNHSHYDGSTPLHLAADKGTDIEVSLLLAFGAEVDAKMKTLPRTPLRNAIVAHKEESVRLLLNNGADRNALCDGNRTPISLAAGCGNYKIVQMILQKPTDVNVSLKDNGWTPLYIAALKGERLMVRMLLEAGAAVNMRDLEGVTALGIAQRSGHSDIVGILRSAGGVE